MVGYQTLSSVYFPKILTVSSNASATTDSWRVLIKIDDTLPQSKPQRDTHHTPNGSNKSLVSTHYTLQRHARKPPPIYSDLQTGHSAIQLPSRVRQARRWS
ncbi:hypothetical protein N7G274_008298 [Stereocaulon virgatum]|uniref:Uncharacterized protein n=1 Tax=Stereocaulon virgatum TaxID=373712 RepID=A0ABR4A1P1_9LECA